MRWPGRGRGAQKGGVRVDSSEPSKVEQKTPGVVAEGYCACSRDGRKSPVRAAWLWKSADIPQGKAG